MVSDDTQTEKNKDIKNIYKLISPNEENLLKGENDIQRLQALLSEWLRMENVVVLTAAGCSASCGGKLMSNLEKSVLDVMLKLIENNKIDTTIKPLIDARLESNNNRVSWKQTNFEEWLSFLVNIIYLGSDDKSPVDKLKLKVKKDIKIQHLKEFVKFMSKAIYAECALTFNMANDIPPHISFLSKLVARESILGRTHLFTLNYDTIFEQALEEIGIQYADGFSGKANAHFDPSVYGLDVHYAGDASEGRIRRFDKFLYFYKLHGSIHWRIDNNKLKSRHEDLSKYVEYRKKDTGQKALDIAKDDFAPDYEKFGILPTSNKFIQTLDMPYSHLFRALSIRLSVPQTFLLVTGYGFGDDHVTQIIETALMNPSLVMLIVEPNPKGAVIERMKKYSELGKRVFILTVTDEHHKTSPFKSATFDDFAKNIMPNVQWLDDFMKLRQYEKKLQSTSQTTQD